LQIPGISGEQYAESNQADLQGLVQKKTRDTIVSDTGDVRL